MDSPKIREAPTSPSAAGRGVVTEAFNLAMKQRDKACKEAVRVCELIRDKHSEMSDAFDEKDDEDNATIHAGACAGAYHCLSAVRAVVKKFGSK